MLAVGVLATLLSCGEQAADRTAAVTLKAAVERTIEADSFQARLISTDGGEQRVSRFEYEAPNRVRIRLRPHGETVWIAGDAYYAMPREPGRFVLVETGCSDALEAALPALSIVHDATEVRRKGPIFVFGSDEGEGITGQARLEGGVLASLLLRYQLPDVNRKVIERYVFSRFGDAISIRRPDASSIAREVSSDRGAVSVSCGTAAGVENI